MIKYYLLGIASILAISLTSSCSQRQKVEKENVEGKTQHLFMDKGNEYSVKIFTDGNENKHYSILVNGKKTGPYVIINNDNNILEKKIFWNDSLFLSKKFYWSENHLDSITFFKYKQYDRNKYEATLSMTYIDSRSPYFEIRFPIFSCNEQMVTLAHYNFDITRIFLTLHREATIPDYSKNYVLTMRSNVREVTLTNSDVRKSSNTFAVDFSKNTPEPEIYNIWSVLMVHPTIVVDCESMPKEVKDKLINRNVVF